ncbi:CRISPR-associated endonuclease Cas2 [Candidatus Aminicenantes bacterium AC-335-K20]|jgi:CRISPR-associated protein Cas2|nr:CRISPR-associated endonuclease Cas2 [SCandidatus Aminicenantes bacterium Aminicenantia_JdfR_composite]MCP2598611.1 CRISPR-associated endonuclease Cas2 [Candidatus Aminicenantes bacterium AC-335-L06]MCP2619581.1 CRISPR-associated endonuclease Cas2 [Candidatus Aminicenantes bacterium AC-335-K20]MCP2620955.1 CRISPR-associated endonuclease Cas2 [Candidatus Aminicenantes bacterium AC-334-E05]
MYLIMVYDIGEKRVAKVLRIARKYLTWIQNSVLEGEITEAKFTKLKLELKKIINEEQDSVVFYIFSSKLYTDREIMGVEKGAEEIVI